VAEGVSPWLCLMVVPQIGGGSIAEEHKRRRGRPATGRDPVRSMRMSTELEAQIAAWIEEQPDPKPSRSEAIRLLIQAALSPRRR